jgi:hypothetical protein
MKPVHVRRATALVAIATVATVVSVVTLGLSATAGAQSARSAPSHRVASACTQQRSSRLGNIAGGIVWARALNASGTACARSHGTGGGTPPSPPYN